MLYINEPLTQDMPHFYRFMGGFDYIRSIQKLNKLSAMPRHWKGNRIEVTAEDSERDILVKFRVYFARVNGVPTYRKIGQTEYAVLKRIEERQ